MPDDTDFLSRWSRRKAAERRAGNEPALEPTEHSALEPATVEPVEPPVSAEALEPPDLPEPDTLEHGSDFKAFMGTDVPTALRRAALRRLWRVNPIIGVLDGLDDHYVTADFTDATRVVPDIRTVYRVGKELVASAERAGEALDRMAASPDRASEVPAADAELPDPAKPMA